MLRGGEADTTELSPWSAGQSLGLLLSKPVRLLFDRFFGADLGRVSESERFFASGESIIFTTSDLPKFEPLASVLGVLGRALEEFHSLESIVCRGPTGKLVKLEKDFGPYMCDRGLSKFGARSLRVCTV